MGFHFVRKITFSLETYEENIVLVDFVKRNNFELDSPMERCGYSDNLQSLIDPEHEYEFFIIRDRSSRVEIYRNCGEILSLIHITEI